MWAPRGTLCVHCHSVTTRGELLSSPRFSFPICKMTNSNPPSSCCKNMRRYTDVLILLISCSRDNTKWFNTIRLTISQSYHEGSGSSLLLCKLPAAPSLRVLSASFKSTSPIPHGCLSPHEDPVVCCAHPGSLGCSPYLTFVPIESDCSCQVHRSCINHLGADFPLDVETEQILPV